MKILKSTSIIIVLTLVFIIFSCTYPLDNPIDPESEEYQGYMIYDDGEIPEDAVFEITGASPEEGVSTIDTTPLFDWNDVDGISSWDLRYSTDESLLEDADIIELSSSGYQIPTTDVFSLDQECFWQVRGVTKAGSCTAWTEVFGFTVNWDVIWSGLSPADGSTTIDTTPVLYWDDVDGANSYIVKTATSNLGLDGEEGTDALLSVYQIEAPLSDGEDLWWQVAAVNSDGVESVYSAKSSVSIDWTLDWSGISPADGSKFYDSTALLDWEDVEGAIGYKIKTASSSENLDLETGTSVPESEYTYTTELTEDEVLWWQVAAVNDEDDEVWSGKYSVAFAAPPEIGSVRDGGIVFYHDGAGNGLVCAESDQGTGEWGGTGYYVGLTSTAVGTGGSNTISIVEAYGNSEPYSGLTNYAAKLCDDLDLNGYDDWFLPSKDELDLMYDNLKTQGIGGFGSYTYWSSSEAGYTSAWEQNFEVGFQRDNGVKNDNEVIRAVRAFSY